MSDEPEKPPSRTLVLLREIRGGNDRAADELLPLVYDELRALARSFLSRERPGQTLQPTALVHEAYLRLVSGASLDWEGRGHFFAAAAEAMRRILIERARRRSRIRHGGGQERITFEEETLRAEPDPETLLLLDDALHRLERHDVSMAKVVKLRYFAGLTVDETASCLDLSARTVNRQWTGARAWLLREMSRTGAAQHP
jgi:RNA polymerase sigma factor (TIGR02999 family)